MASLTAERINYNIEKSWVYHDVARWVVSNLALLSTQVETESEPSIHDLTIDSDTYNFNGREELSDSFLYVVSGGLEGTKGHLAAVQSMKETRKLVKHPSDPFDDEKEYPVKLGVLLEPDSYIYTVKGREPLVFQEERATLWKESGLVDFVVNLPEKPTNISVETHYQKIHRALGNNVRWFATGEHAHFMDVLTRHKSNWIFTQLVWPVNVPHASFLAATQTMSLEDLEEIYDQVMLDGWWG